MSNLCIIPARGGSKRIPRKNIKDFLGKPIIAYSIEAAIESELFDEVMVSTEDQEIAQIAQEYGAKIPFMRTKEKANDFATTYEVIEEVLVNYKKEDVNFENACCLYPCAPLITVGKLQEAFYKLQNCDTVFPVVKYSFPIQRALQKDKKDRVSYFQPEYETTRSQDLKQSYHDAGQFYWFKVIEILKNRSILTDNTAGIELSELEVQDIDNAIDWKLAELKYRLQHEVS